MWWLTSVIPATQETETGRIAAQASQGKKLNPMSTNKLGEVVHACHSSCVGGVNRRIEVQAGPGKNV
jgi:hypothetical protein